MTATLSDDTKAILLLTAPLIAGPGSARHRPLSLGDYKQLARKLRELVRKPADLIAPSADDLIDACGAVVDAGRLRELLSRGFQMAQAVERWSARAIWVISRADELYPRRWKERLKEDCPPILYGCGRAEILSRRGLAVVGSRDADDDTLAWARQAGKIAASVRVSVVSGGARGIDDAAVRGSLEDGGFAAVVLADSLEKEAIKRANRSPIMNDRLVLVSPYDPAARFNVGHAMGRNKLVHCLAEASLVVRCEDGSGGTWAGAVEHLGRSEATPLYVRNGDAAPEGNRALLARNAHAWPEPMSAARLEELIASAKATRSTPKQNTLFPATTFVEETQPSEVRDVPAAPSLPEAPPATPAQRLFDAAKPIILGLLAEPHREKEIADALKIPLALAKQWLSLLVAAGEVGKSSRPVQYRCVEPALAIPDTAPKDSPLTAG